MMSVKRTTAAGLSVLTLAGSLALGACGESGTPAPSSSAARSGFAALSEAPCGPPQPRPTGSAATCGDIPWKSWGPGMRSGRYGLPGDGTRVVTLDQARHRANAFAYQLGLRVGEIMQFSRNYYVELATSSGHPATEALVDPATGGVQIEYGPAMMRNTDHGMMRGSGRSHPRISSEQARSTAQQWLRRHGNTMIAGDPEPYPGYYTLHTLQDGAVKGMLSVNASTGAVWYHSWHGTYIATSPG